MSGIFRMSDLGLLLHYYIGIEVEQGPIRSLGRCLVKGHMQQRYHLVQESIDSDLINVKFVKNEYRLPDVLMKPLCKAKFSKIRFKISLLIDVGSSYHKGLRGVLKNKHWMLTLVCYSY